jgi:hypothetical protein
VYFFRLSSLREVYSSPSGKTKDLLLSDPGRERKENGAWGRLSYDTVLSLLFATVIYICTFHSPPVCFRFFENPWKWMSQYRNRYAYRSKPSTERQTTSHATVRKYNDLIFQHITESSWVLVLHLPQDIIQSQSAQQCWEFGEHLLPSRPLIGQKHR